MPLKRLKISLGIFTNFQICLTREYIYYFNRYIDILRKIKKGVVKGKTLRNHKLTQNNGRDTTNTTGNI